MTRSDPKATRQPALSVILASPGGKAGVGITLAHLLRQTVCSSTELVLVCPSRDLLDVAEDELDRFHSHQFVELADFHSVGAANAAGVRAARADIVALAEDHCFPEPDWAEHLLAAHARGYAAVGPSVSNANPGSRLSWGDFLLGYGRFALPRPSREVVLLPGHNTSYKRSVLLEFAHELEDMLNSETVLQWELQRRGHRLFLESRARVAHTGFATWSSFVQAQFLNGWNFAGERARGMSAWRRAVYVLGSPLLPAYRLARMARDVPVELHSTILRNLPELWLGLCLDAAGQQAGYITGENKVLSLLTPFEFNRDANIPRADREALYERD